MKRPLAVLATHPIQYYSPWFAKLARALPLKVFYAHRQTPRGQALSGFGVGFEWDLPLLEGYDHRFLRNVATRPGLDSFDGCDTPEIGAILLRERFRALVLLGWNKKSYVQAGVAAWRTGTPLLVRVDSQLGKPRFGQIGETLKTLAYSAILPAAAGYLSPGQRTDAYLERYRVPPRRIHRLPHMVDVERFATGAEQARHSGAVAALRARHGVRADDVVFLYVGKMIEKKRPDLLLEGFARFQANRGPEAPRAHLWLVGSGPMEMQLRQRAAGLPCAFLGFVNQSEMPSMYASGDCLVLPSDHGETWGLVVNEAMACGVPAIVSEEAGCAHELVEEGATGWMMRRPEADHLARLMAEAEAGCRALDRDRLAATSRRFGYDVGSKRLLEILDTVIVHA